MSVLFFLTVLSYARNNLLLRLTPPTMIFGVWYDTDDAVSSPSNSLSSVKNALPLVSSESPKNADADGERDLRVFTDRLVLDLIRFSKFF
jgi:hypothetical protein